MKLVYKGSARRLSGSGMAFADLNNSIALEENMGKELYLGVGDTFLRIERVEGDTLFFGVRFFDKVTSYALKQGEQVTHRQEGNAFGFELTFELSE